MDYKRYTPKMHICIYKLYIFGGTLAYHAKYICITYREIVAGTGTGLRANPKINFEAEVGSG